MYWLIVFSEFKISGVPMSSVHPNPSRSEKGTHSSSTYLYLFFQLLLSDVFQASFWLSPTMLPWEVRDSKSWSKYQHPAINIKEDTSATYKVSIPIEADTESYLPTLLYQMKLTLMFFFDYWRVSVCQNWPWAMRFINILDFQKAHWLTYKFNSLLVFLHPGTQAVRVTGRRG